MAGLDGKDSVPAGSARSERGNNRAARAVDVRLRAGVLLGDMSAGHISGCRVVVKCTAQEKEIPLFLFARPVMAALRRVGCVRSFPYFRVEFGGGPVGPVQCLRTDSGQPFQPVYLWGNNLLAYVAERADSYAFYETEVWLKSLPTFIIAVITLVAVCILAWRNGRTYCNAVCPVGTVLGFLSRYSLLRPVIDTERCNGCGLCARRCKAACIDPKAHRIDYSRCVTCMDCLDTCKRHAISYELRRGKAAEPEDTPEPGVKGVSPEQIDQARRAFLSATALVTATSTVRAQEKKVDGGLAVIEDKQAPRRSTRIVPPGALSIRNFERHCTACQLCVSVCPSGVLRPSSSLSHLMQPEMSYERGYCRPECTKCAEVCPAGAIRPITRAEKSSVLIGHAVWFRKNCIPLTDGRECDNCARHCPTKAIEMVLVDAAGSGSLKTPVINTEKCIGCGACENLCPARPFSAIYIEGHKAHRIV